MTLDFSNAMQLHDFNDMNSFPCNLRSLTVCLSEVIFMEGFMRKVYQSLSSLEVLHLIGIWSSAIFFCHMHISDFKWTDECTVGTVAQYSMNRESDASSDEGVVAGHSGQFTPGGYLSTLWYTLL